MTTVTGASILPTQLKFQTFITTHKIPKDIFGPSNKEPANGASSQVFQQLLTRTKSKGSRDFKDEGILRTLAKGPDDSRQKIKVVNFEPKKALQNPGEASNRLKSTPLRGYHPNRIRVGYEQRNSFFINTPTVGSTVINGSFEKPSKNYLSTSIAETHAAAQNSELIVKSRTKLNLESDVIDEIEEKKPVALIDELKKDTIIGAEHIPSLQTKTRTSQSPLRELGGSQRLQRRSQSTLRLRDFYLLRETPSKQGLSQQFIKSPACKENSDSANARKSIKFIETPKDIETIAARAMKHVKSISGHYIQIKGPVNMEGETYHMPISRFNQVITGKETKSLLRSISYANSRKQSESRDSSYKDIEYRSMVDRSFKGNTKETTIMMETKENSHEISRIRTREDHDGKPIRAWRVSLMLKDRRKEGISMTSGEKIEEKYEREEVESKRDYKLQTDEEIVDSDRPRSKVSSKIQLPQQQDEKEDEAKGSDFGSVGRRSSREILLSYKNKRSGLFINHNKVMLSSYVNAMDPAKNKEEDTRTKEDISLEASLIKPLEKMSPTNL